MKRGEVWLIDFEPSVGGEIKKRRPAIIVGSNVSNKFLNRVQIVPLTSKKTEKIYPSEALVTLNGKQGKALADQLTTLSILRLSNLEGKISTTDLNKVENAIKIQLDL